MWFRWASHGSEVSDRFHTDLGRFSCFDHLLLQDGDGSDIGTRWIEWVLGKSWATYWDKGSVVFTARLSPQQLLSWLRDQWWWLTYSGLSCKILMRQRIQQTLLEFCLFPWFIFSNPDRDIVHFLLLTVFDACAWDYEPNDKCQWNKDQQIPSILHLLFFQCLSVCLQSTSKVSIKVSILVE